MTQSKSGLNLALQWHLWMLQVHGSSHVGIVFSWDCPLRVLAFTIV